MNRTMIFFAIVLLSCGAALTPHEVAPPAEGLSQANEDVSETTTTITSGEVPQVEARPDLERLLVERLQSRVPEERRVMESAHLGALSVDDGTFFAFRVHAQHEDGLGELLFLGLAIPHEGSHALVSVMIGESFIVPGEESTTTFESFDGFTVEHDVVRAELALVSRMTYYDTCSECLGRRAEAPIRRRLVLICAEAEQHGEYECTTTTIALEFIEPGYEIDADGNRLPYPQDAYIAPDEFVLSLTIVDSQTIRLDRVSGTLSQEQEASLGEIEIENLRDIGEVAEPI